MGEYCQHLNPCHTGPRCQNGGSCRVKESSGGGTPSFTCSCPVGFTASLCEIPIENACDSSPCLNGATCNLKSLREYVCTCATGYTGKDLSVISFSKSTKNKKKKTGTARRDVTKRQIFIEKKSCTRNPTCSPVTVFFSTTLQSRLCAFIAAQLFRKRVDYSVR